MEENKARCTLALLGVHEQRKTINRTLGDQCASLIMVEKRVKKGKERQSIGL